MMMITLEYVQDKRHACYEPDRLARLFDRPLTPVEVLTRKDGEWSDVPPEDRLWVVLADGVIPDRTMRLFACWCADQALATVKNPDPRSIEAVRVARHHADVITTDKELASAAASAAARARAVAWAWATDSARAAAEKAAGEAQVLKLVEMLTPPMAEGQDDE